MSLFLLSIVLVTACKNTPVISQKESPPLIVNIYLWPGYFPMVIASEKGFFQQQGVNVKPVYSNSYLTSVSEVNSGKYDGIATTMGSIMNIIGKDPEMQIVLVTDQSAGADAVVVQRNIQQVADLKGKRIGVKLGDFGELFVTTMLEKNGLTNDDVRLVNVEAEAVPTHLKSGDIQGGHTWEPHLSQLAKSEAYVLFSTKQTPGLIPGIVVFRSSVVREHPEQIKAFIRAWFQAQDYWKANAEECKALIAKTLSIKPEEVTTDGIQLYTLKENLKAFTPGTTPRSLYHTAQLYADFFIRKGVLSAAPDIQKLIAPFFVQQLQKVN
jgi:NitT/TauT family transport system substrate-binding protein